VAGSDDVVCSELVVGEFVDPGVVVDSVAVVGKTVDSVVD
jgi:hypothetical protein